MPRAKLAIVRLQDDPITDPLEGSEEGLAEAEARGNADGQRYEHDPHLVARASIDDLILQFVGFGDELNAIYTPSPEWSSYALLLVRQVPDPLEQDRLLAHAVAHHVLGHNALTRTLAICFPDPAVVKGPDEGLAEWRQQEQEADAYAAALTGAAAALYGTPAAAAVEALLGLGGPA